MGTLRKLSDDLDILAQYIVPHNLSEQEQTEINAFIQKSKNKAIKQYAKRKRIRKFSVQN